MLKLGRYLARIYFKYGLSDSPTTENGQYICDFESLAIVYMPPFLCSTRYSRDVFPLPLFGRIFATDYRAMTYTEQCIQRSNPFTFAEARSLRLRLFGKLFTTSDEGLTDNEIHDDAQSYIIAESDTTASILTYIIWTTYRVRKIAKSLD
ncbi:hypothetical protein B0O99DRAFT_23909 [Bisporella sp. PMI_857]|nr:hypothetical protein B0O99DRAFT_23909 [Bisporella sp. PMI_857]